MQSTLLLLAGNRSLQRNRSCSRVSLENKKWKVSNITRESHSICHLWQAGNTSLSLASALMSQFNWKANSQSQCTGADCAPREQVGQSVERSVWRCRICNNSRRSSCISLYQARFIFLMGGETFVLALCFSSHNSQRGKPEHNKWTGHFAQSNTALCWTQWVRAHYNVMTFNRENREELTRKHLHYHKIDFALLEFLLLIDIIHVLAKHLVCSNFLSVW